MVKYSKVYKVADLTKTDKEFIHQNEFCCACSDDLTEIAANPEKCTKGVLMFVSENGFNCSTVFEDTTKDGHCWGGYDFGSIPFKYIRIAVNPYGEDEFTYMPSEKIS